MNYSRKNKQETKLIFNKDVNVDYMKNSNVGIVGFGNQGKAQALNIYDRNINIKIALRNNSNSIRAVSKIR